MEKLSVWEFRDLCQSRGFSRYIYETDMQDWDSPYQCFRLSAAFDRVQLFLGPASLCFRSADQTLTLQPVKYLIFEDGAPPEFTVVCGVHGTGRYDQVFRFAAE